MEAKWYQSLSKDQYHFDLVIGGQDIAAFLGKADPMDRELWRQCWAPGSLLADHLLALECMARRLGEWTKSPKAAAFIDDAPPTGRPAC